MFDSSRLARAIGLTVGLAAGAAGVGAVAALRRPLPKVSGRLPLSGLAARAEVRRDRWGVPHIYADADRDLFAALGYVHAQDRLWQMELNRRTAHGRLAEIFGPVALSSDQFIRTLGFSRVAYREVALLDDHTRDVVEAYVRGVNAFLDGSRGRLPLEFTVLGFTPRPWEAADILAWPKIMALNLCLNWTSELLNAQIVARVGAERAAELAPRYPGEAPISVPPGFHLPAHLGEAALRLAEEAAPFTGEPGPSQGSNGWAVGPARTASGRPMLAEDPHLGLALPGIWYVAHLHGGSYRAAGITCPGTCGIIIGHNERIAWGQTNAATDVQDLYVERFDAADPLRYQFRGEWRVAELAREEIAVKGQAPVTLEVRVTHHGPVVDAVAGPDASPLARPEGGAPGGYREALALRWSALDPSPALTRSVLRLNRARDWDEFRAALEDWDTPPQNFVYADADGHFGYALAGKLPIRPRSDGQLPVEGWPGEDEWQGFIPNAELPAALDPPAGLVVTANNRIAADDHPRHAQIHGEWSNPYRAARIEALLRATERHEVRSFARIQADWRSAPGLSIARLVAALPVQEPLERTARSLLAAWDGQLTPDSAAAAIYDAVRHHLARVVYAELGDLLLAQGGLGAFGSIPANIYLVRALPGIIARAEAANLDAPDPWLGGRTWAAVIGEALRLAVAELRAKLGPDPARWSYGRVHALTLRHPLGAVPALASIFNRGPWPMGGDVDTVCMQFAPRDTAAGPHYHAPSYRQIFDPGDWDSARVILPAGQSGHPASSHYADMAAAWRAGGYFPLLWSREAVERHTADVLTLEPAP
jgi:penicillin amidase